MHFLKFIKIQNKNTGIILHVNNHKQKFLNLI